MKNFKLSNIMRVVAVLVLVLVITMVSVACSGGVDAKYQYNTEIISLENSPVSGDPVIEEITGFTEDKKQDFLELPYMVGDTNIQIVAVGSYTGPYVDNGTYEDVSDVLAIVITNTSDKIISYSNFTVEFAKNLKCSFSPTNIPAHQSALLLPLENAVSYDDVKKFEVTDSMQVLSNTLPLIAGTVGVDYKDGEFIITNLTGNNLGDVYIRYKNVSSGNVYLGGITLSEVVKDVQSYETYMVEVERFDPETSVIVSVESIVSQ